MHSDFIIGQVTRETPFLPFLYYLWCMAQRSLHAITKIYYRSMSCFATVFQVDTQYHDPAYSAMVSQGRYVVPRPLLHHVCLGEISNQSPLIRTRHTTYSIPN
jgi:hypothetical protein